MVGFVGWQISKSRFIMVGVATDRSGEEIKTVATNLELSELAGIVGLCPYASTHELNIVMHQWHVSHAADGLLTLKISRFEQGNRMLLATCCELLNLWPTC